MKPKTLITLLILVCALSVVVFFFFSKEEEPSSQGEKLFSNLPVNDIVAIDIANADETISLSKGESVWTVKEKFRYPADFEKITKMVRTLNDVKVGRNFKVTDEVISRLGLRILKEGEAKTDEETGTSIALKGEDNTIIADLILGKSRASEKGSGGHYLMLADESMIYLVDKNFSFIDKKPEDWLNKDLLDIKSSDVEKVTCFNSDKIVYEINRPEKGKPPELLNPPETEKVKKPEIEKVIGALASLRLTDVANPTEDFAIQFDDAPYFEYKLFDGTVYTVFTGKAAKDDEEKFYFKIKVSFIPPEVEETEEPEEAEDETTESEDIKKPIAADSADPDKEKAVQEEEDEISPEELTAIAEELNKKYSTWTYLIAKWENEKFIADMNEFFETEEKEE